MLASITRNWLLAVARRELREAMAKTEPSAASLYVPAFDRPTDPVLDEPSRVFVSWHDGPQLVGCIGTLEPNGTLESGIRKYAVAAGLHDPRTPPARPDRWESMHCEISILSEPRPLAVVGLGAIAKLLVRGRDGVILHHEDRRAFFLPVVWDKLPEPDDFLAALCRKAGLDPEVHGPLVQASVLEVEMFGEGIH